MLKPGHFNGTVIRPLRNVDPNQEEYTGIIAITNEGKITLCACFNLLLLLLCHVVPVWFYGNQGMLSFTKNTYIIKGIVQFRVRLCFSNLIILRDKKELIIRLDRGYYFTRGYEVGLRKISPENANISRNMNLR